MTAVLVWCSGVVEKAPTWHPNTTYSSRLLPHMYGPPFIRHAMDPINLKKPPASRRTSVAVVIIPVVNPPAWNVPIYDEAELEAELIC